MPCQEFPSRQSDLFGWLNVLLCSDFFQLSSALNMGRRQLDQKPMGLILYILTQIQNLPTRYSSNLTNTSPALFGDNDSKPVMPILPTR
jgi:hypothetical protein